MPQVKYGKLSAAQCRDGRAKLQQARDALMASTQIVDRAKFSDRILKLDWAIRRLQIDLQWDAENSGVNPEELRV